MTPKLVKEAVEKSTSITVDGQKYTRKISTFLAPTCFNMSFTKYTTPVAFYSYSDNHKFRAGNYNVWIPEYASNNIIIYDASRKVLGFYNLKEVLGLSDNNYIYGFPSYSGTAAYVFVVNYTTKSVYKLSFSTASNAHYSSIGTSISTIINGTYTLSTTSSTRGYYVNFVETASYYAYCPSYTTIKIITKATNAERTLTLPGSIASPVEAYSNTCGVFLLAGSNTALDIIFFGNTLNSTGTKMDMHYTQYRINLDTAVISTVANKKVFNTINKTINSTAAYSAYHSSTHDYVTSDIVCMYVGYNYTERVDSNSKAYSGHIIVYYNKGTISVATQIHTGTYVGCNSTATAIYLYDSSVPRLYTVYDSGNAGYRDYALYRYNNAAITKAGYMGRLNNATLFSMSAYSSACSYLVEMDTGDRYILDRSWELGIGSANSSYYSLAGLFPASPKQYPAIIVSSVSNLDAAYDLRDFNVEARR